MGLWTTWRAVAAAALLLIPAGGAGAQERSFVILAVNDVYRIAGVEDGRFGGLARLRSLRAELEREHPDLLLLHAGDFLYPSLLSRIFDGAQMVDMLNRLDGDKAGFDERLLITFGNHEFDKGRLEHAALLKARLAESQFRWLASNLVFGKGKDGQPLVGGDNLLPSVLVESGGVQVGVFSLTIDTKKPAYVAEFLDRDAVARATTAELRGRGAEVVIALTHLAITEDQARLQRLGGDGPDLIIGGHEHARLQTEVDGRWVLKADADARSATVVKVTLARSGPPAVYHEYRALGPLTAPDPQLAARVAGWLDRHDRVFCARIALPPGCLAEPFGTTRVDLIGEELEIRRFETNLGDWIADQALEAFARDGAQAAAVNSGSLRLNQDIAAGSTITRRTVEEIFQYETDLALLRIDGATLQKMIERAVEDWTGSGHWLQISGFAFRHHPDSGSASDLTLLAPEGPRPVDPTETILLVAPRYLYDPSIGDQDGYTMLNPGQVISEQQPDLKERVRQALIAAGTDGIAPPVAGDGRICNSLRERPCRAVAR